MFESQLAQSFFDLKIIQFVIDNPIRFKSGLISPVYMDNRCIPYYPELWFNILQGLAKLSQNINFDIIAGVEAAGIPHSAALGFLLKKPSVFVRKEIKEHGTKKLVEGGNVKGKKVLLVEDMITTGGSSLKAIEQLRMEGAIIENCFCISNYELPQANENFKKHHITLHTLLPFKVIFKNIKHLLDDNTVKAINQWIKDNNLNIIYD